MNQAELIKFFHNDLSTFNWQIIADKLNQQFGTARTMQQCKQIYLDSYGENVPKDWMMEEEKELYRLHDKLGNKWSTIASYFIGRYTLKIRRSDNCVKNKIYAKMRKSLRALNKVVKICFRKEFKEISPTILYKLTQAGEQKAKGESGIEEELICKGRDLKNSLLDYEGNQSIKKDNDYTMEKLLIKELLNFNKNYKKKTKKQKIEDSTYNQNIKKALSKKKSIYKKNFQEPLIKIQQSDKIALTLEKKLSNEQMTKKLINVFIKAPTLKEQDQLKKSSINENNGIEDILKTCGILQNGQEQTPFLKRQNSLKGLSRRSSFSNVSESSFDMFGEDFKVPLNNQLSEMQGDSEIFHKSQQ